MITTTPTYLENYILVSNGAYPAGTLPKSGLYIDVLPGISLENVADIAGAEYTTGRELVETKVQLAAKKILATAWTSIEQEMNAPHELEKRRTIGNFKNTLSTAMPRGVQLIRGHSMGDKLQTTYIHHLEACFYHSGEVTIYFQDRNGNILHQITTTTTAGQVTEIEVEKHFTERIVIITANVEMYEVDLYPFRNGCSSCSNRKSYRLQVQGWKGNELDYNTLVNTGYGFRVCASVRCNLRTYEEQILPQLAEAILYQSGVEILLEWKSSNRLSFLVIEKNIDELLPEFQEAANDLLTEAVPRIINDLQKESSACLKAWNGYRSVSLV